MKLDIITLQKLFIGMIILSGNEGVVFDYGKGDSESKSKSYYQKKRVIMN